MPFAREGGILSTQPHLFVMGDEMSKKCVYLMLSVMLTLMATAGGTAAASGAAAPAFTLRDINGASVSLSDFKGKVVLLNFWATWCGPCKQEMPHLDKLDKDFGPQGFKVLSISTDDARAASKVKPYIKGRGYGFTVLLDKDTSVVSQFNPSKTLPYTVLIGRSGNIQKVFQGYKPGDEVHLREQVKSMVESGQ
jgi:peroxiredoxin